MNRDYAYCNDYQSCIHRYGCKRWIGNYKTEEIEEWRKGKTMMIDKIDCKNENEHIIDGIDDSGEPYGLPFRFLDRFRSSDERD